jgi:capsular exopolysaccharide synthesis family protein
MGRIDDALRRSNIDAARGTGAPTASREATPWQFEQPDGGDAREPARSEGGKVAEAPADRPVPGEDRRRAPWGGFDTGALERLVASNAAEPLLVEQFRSLAASLHRAQSEQPLKSVIVTSPSPGDGKSHVAVNLALTLSDSYRRRVLLIDADLRRPTLHVVFRIPNTRGLSEALKAKTDEKMAAATISETLTLLPAGRPEANPLGGLSSDRMKRIVADAGSRFDWVIVDSPPVGVLADARLVSETVDAAILVVRAGVTRFPDLEAAADTLGHERILGVVLNAVDPASIRGGGYYRDYYRREPAKS